MFLESRVNITKNRSCQEMATGCGVVQGRRSEGGQSIRAALRGAVVLTSTNKGQLTDEGMKEVGGSAVLFDLVERAIKREGRVPSPYEVFRTVVSFIE